MNGEQALIYSRIRENQLNPGENDLTRAARQQAVAQAADGEARPRSATLLGLPFDGSSLMKPLATDLSTWQLIELGWVKFRASGVTHALLPARRRRDERRRLVGARPVARTTAACSRCGPGSRRRSRRRRRSGPGCRAGHPLQ